MSYCPKTDKHCMRYRFCQSVGECAGLVEQDTIKRQLVEQMKSIDAASTHQIAAVSVPPWALLKAGKDAEPEVTYRMPAAIYVAIRQELQRAAKWPAFNSAHEGYAILLEEMDELKEHVWMKQRNRDLDAMRAEAIQVAAMAVKFVEMIDAGRGRA